MIDPPSREIRPLSPRAIRRLGWVLIGVGAFLVLFMGYIALVVGRIILHSNDPDATTRFTGGPGMILFTFAVFGVVIAFGLVSLLNGIWQVRYGKRNPHFLQWMFWMIPAFGLFGVLAGIIEFFD